MNKRTRIIVLYSTLTVAVVGAGGLAYGAIDSSGGSTGKTATRLVSASVGTVSQTVSATGTVQPATSLDLNFVNSGVLSAVSVKAGDKVKAGQVLGTIDPAKAKVGLEMAQANLSAAQQKLDQAKNPPATPSGDTPAVDAVAVAQAKAAVNQAALNVSDAQKALDATTLKAPSAGTISAINFSVGQTVGGGGTSATSSSGSSSGSSTGSSASSKAFATLLDLDHMVVKVGFPEADAGKITAGQPVTLTIDSLTGQRPTGTVDSIDTVSTVVSNVVTYNAIIAFDAVPAAVKPGMTANVSVITASRDNVVSVPSAAISTKSGASTVTVRTAGQDETRNVVAGLKGDGTTEITSGLNGGDQVVMSVGVVSSSASNTGTQTRTGTGTVGGIGGTGTGGGFGGAGGGNFGPRG
ncbi:MAG TPA: HlyD family efflux transporter periplasmic adaptor subunit [Acidimicrobiia bacterium]|nr:HlyD family efflux transporter periplasmic adaptor subunit [Acidimicrobiia bacterium]